MEQTVQSVSIKVGMLHIKRAVTIRRPRGEVYEFWRDLSRLPSFMIHLHAVTVTDERRSHWIANAPGGHVEWDAEIIDDRPNALIAWQALPGSEVLNGGLVRFADAPADRGTEVHVSLHYDPPAGAVGAAVASWFGEEPGQQLQDDLRRLKQVMETGEVVRSDGSLDGAGEGATRERAAQPLAPEVRS